MERTGAGTLASVLRPSPTPTPHLLIFRTDTDRLVEGAPAGGFGPSGCMACVLENSSLWISEVTSVTLDGVKPTSGIVEPGWTRPASTSGIRSKIPPSSTVPPLPFDPPATFENGPPSLANTMFLGSPPLPPTDVSSQSAPFPGPLPNPSASPGASSHTPIPGNLPSAELLYPSSQNVSGLNWNPALSSPSFPHDHVLVLSRVSDPIPSAASTTPPSSDMDPLPSTPTTATQPLAAESSLVLSTGSLPSSLLAPSLKPGTKKTATLSADATCESCAAGPAVTSLGKLRRGEGAVTQQDRAICKSCGFKDIVLPLHGQASSMLTERRMTFTCGPFDITACMDSASLADRAAQPRTLPEPHPTGKRKKGPIKPRSNVVCSACSRGLGAGLVHVRGDVSPIVEDPRREVRVDPVFDVEVVCAPCWEKYQLCSVVGALGSGPT
ncbi:hypothetical protein BDK51DRAFT_40280 [Blyttiomyces helicus]|uniref:Uncharacterized protein n=1 Tax=Blyttiomyces helicus TaxID=388810 RepID=A0A4V1IPX8_9FUNG|nr:hypothetical protein BDK51DRAFT_40280 [Blyttiomyces helicus]|eukprot:RKO84607.1 hypothetical protein BDK51DRAFT_40280 [Blyttiomyces helicus]